MSAEPVHLRFTFWGSAFESSRANALVVPIAGQPAATVAAAIEPKKALRERVFMTTSSYYIEIVEISVSGVTSQVLAPRRFYICECKLRFYRDPLLIVMAAQRRAPRSRFSLLERYALLSNIDQ